MLELPVVMREVRMDEGNVADLGARAANLALSRDNKILSVWLKVLEHKVLHLWAEYSLDLCFLVAVIVLHLPELLCVGAGLSKLTCHEHIVSHFSLMVQQSESVLPEEVLLG